MNGFLESLDVISVWIGVMYANDLLAKQQQKRIKRIALQSEIESYRPPTKREWEEQQHIQQNKEFLETLNLDTDMTSYQSADDIAGYTVNIIEALKKSTNGQQIQNISINWEVLDSDGDEIFTPQINVTYFQNT